MSTPHRPRRALPKLGLRPTDKRRHLVQVTLTGQVPAHPATADHLSAVAEWNGATNYRFGTCGPCMCANSAMQAWKYLLNEDITVTDQAVYDLYRRSGNPNFDPATGEDDNGVDMTVMLAELVRNGIEITHADGSSEYAAPLVFGQIALQPYDNIHAVTAIAGAVGFGLDLDAAQQSQTGNGLWSYVPGSPPWGGHATLGGAYTSAADPAALDETNITWQRPVGTTPDFLAHQLSEAYLIVWEPLWNHPAFVDGIDQAALVASYEEVTGRAWTGPVPQSPVTPQPQPVPGDVALEGFLNDQRLIRWAAARHVGENRYAAGCYNELREHELGV